jgi:hypothetical protein
MSGSSGSMGATGATGATAGWFDTRTDSSTIDATGAASCIAVPEGDAARCRGVYDRAPFRDVPPPLLPGGTEPGGTEPRLRFPTMMAASNSSSEACGASGKTSRGTSARPAFATRSMAPSVRRER